MTGFLLTWLVCIIGAAWIASVRGNNWGWYSLLGFFTGPVGLIVALIAPSGFVECLFCKRQAIKGTARCGNCGQPLVEFQFKGM
jgi:hypothetical protein